MKVARKHRAKSKYPRHLHSYARNIATGVESKAWAQASTEVHDTVRLIDSVKDNRNSRTIYDTDGRDIGIKSGDLGIEPCPGATCANCEDKTSVWWVRAHGLAARLAPGKPVTCAQDICVRQCTLCGNWTRFFRTSTVKRAILRWSGGSELHSRLNTPVWGITSALELDFAQKRI